MNGDSLVLWERAMERIRELEAELRWAREGISASNPSEPWWPKNTTQKVQRQMIMEWKARAEKAEARVAELERFKRLMELRVRLGQGERIETREREAESPCDIGAPCSTCDGVRRLDGLAKSSCMHSCHDITPQEEAREREAE